MPVVGIISNVAIAKAFGKFHVTISKKVNPLTEKGIYQCFFSKACFFTSSSVCVLGHSC